MAMNYDLKKDITTALKLKSIDINAFCTFCDIPKRTLLYNFHGEPSLSILEKVYSGIYQLGIRLSEAKSEVFEELVNQKNIILYHGSKSGITTLSETGSRADCDFGAGFYLTKVFASARSFVESIPSSSVYAFSLLLDNLKIVEFNCDLEWMLAICYYRGKLRPYKNHPVIQSIVQKVERADIVIAPIADNKMFEVLNRFANDEITTAEAIHALSASRLGKQYVLKTKHAVGQLSFLDRLFLCMKEREQSLSYSVDNQNIIQTKLDFAKHEYRSQGQYISEVFK